MALPGQPVSVWVYADTEPSSNDCLDLSGDLIPISAPDGIPGKAVTCTFRYFNRPTLIKGQDGYYHLQSIQLFVLLGGNYPTPAPGATPGAPACASVLPIILPASRPSTDAAYVGVCDYVPPLRGTETTETLVWTRVRDSIAPNPLPADLACWQTLRYLNGTEIPVSELRDVTCAIAH